MADYGINVSKAGFDVKSLMISGGSLRFAHPASTVFSSGYFVFKITSTGTGTMSIGSTAGITRVDTTTIAHNLGYAPQVGLFFSTDGGTTWRNNNGSTTGVSASPENGIWISADSSQITINVFSENMSAYTINYRYTVYVEQGT